MPQTGHVWHAAASHIRYLRKIGKKSSALYGDAWQHLKNRDFVTPRPANAFTGPLSPARREKLVESVRWARLRTNSAPDPPYFETPFRPVDPSLAGPRPKSALDGRFLAIKDNFCTQDSPTTCASAVLQGFQPPRDAWAVYMLKVPSGALSVGNTNMDEFGMGSHSINSYYGPVTNWMGNTARSAGGSSGGSAMAVLTNQCYLALGTDTGGSVRLPAAYAACIGFKPSYGMISRYGVVPYANSLDTVGIIAQSCWDVIDTFALLSKHDPRDPTCLSPATRTRIRLKRRTRLEAIYSRSPPTVALKQLPRQISKRISKPNPFTRQRIGVPMEYNIKELSDSVREAWVRTLSFLEAKGHEIVPITLPATKHALSAYYILAPAEASSNLAKYDGVRYGARQEDGSDTADGILYSKTRGQKFGPEVQRRILLGAYSLSADAIENYFIQAQKVRRLVQKDFDAVFRMENPLRDGAEPPENGVDFIICPTAPTPPPLLDDVSSSNPLDAYMNDVFTVPASLAGLPAISVPAPPTDPASPIVEKFIGMQVIGQYGNDWSVLHFAAEEMQMGQDWDNARKSTYVREHVRVR